MLTPAAINALNSLAVICLAALLLNTYRKLLRLERALLQLIRYDALHVTTPIRRILRGEL